MLWWLFISKVEGWKTRHKRMSSLKNLFQKFELITIGVGMGMARGQFVLLLFLIWRREKSSSSCKIIGLNVYLAAFKISIICLIFNRSNFAPPPFFSLMKSIGGRTNKYRVTHKRWNYKEDLKLIKYDDSKV